MNMKAGLLAVIALLPWSATSWAEWSFDPRYERDYNLFTPARRYVPDNPLNPAHRYNVDLPFAPLDGMSRKRNTR